ncbi:hypothetical protein CTAYLR_008347 [Chrysophaeum taylorii]|uniref:Ethanolaminephosphotransferase n=1 Tax=Chrysophaeum taylorii TaxID=2483200 RepID=A0AAD7XLB2_9STRA|nr:hypothetical protein CTAYLR_008347 [Chrysophaeum taylorii]
MGFYITPAGAEAIKKYKYSGSDLSYYFRYVLTPMNVRLVEWLPVWLAPNVITVAGLCFLLVALALSVFFSPSLESPLPSALYVYIAFAQFAYQTLDNLDGRQARRTDNSSPLGLLCDHGSDALAVTVLTLVLAAVVRCGGGSAYLVVLWFALATPFFFATWEEYYAGSLVLGVVNGPSDGILVGMLCALLPAVYGADFWLQPVHVPGTITRVVARHWILLGLLVLSVIPTVLSNVHNVARKRRSLGKGMGAPVRALGPFVLLTASVFVWLRYSTLPLLERHPRAVIGAVGIVFGNIACKLMLAHLCGHGYKLRRFSLLPLVLAAANSCCGAALVNERVMLFVALGFAFVCWLHFVVVVSWELTMVLGIRVFFVKPIRKNKAM